MKSIIKITITAVLSWTFSQTLFANSNADLDRYPELVKGNSCNNLELKAKISAIHEVVKESKNDRVKSHISANLFDEYGGLSLGTLYRRASYNNCIMSEEERNDPMSIVALNRAKQMLEQNEGLLEDLRKTTSNLFTKKEEMDIKILNSFKRFDKRLEYYSRLDLDLKKGGQICVDATDSAGRVIESRCSPRTKDHDELKKYRELHSVNNGFDLKIKDFKNYKIKNGDTLLVGALEVRAAKNCNILKETTIAYKNIKKSFKNTELTYEKPVPSVKKRISAVNRVKEIKYKNPTYCKYMKPNESKKTENAAF